MGTGRTPTGKAHVKAVAQVVENVLLNKADELSGDDLRQRLQMLVTPDTDDKAAQACPAGVWISDVFDTFFVYQDDGVFYRQGYTRDGDTVALDGDPVEVERKTTYEVVKFNENHDERGRFSTGEGGGEAGRSAENARSINEHVAAAKYHLGRADALKGQPGGAEHLAAVSVHSKAATNGGNYTHDKDEPLNTVYSMLAREASIEAHGSEDTGVAGLRGYKNYADAANAADSATHKAGLTNTAEDHDAAADAHKTAAQLATNDKTEGGFQNYKHHMSIAANHMEHADEARTADDPVAHITSTLAQHGINATARGPGAGEHLSGRATHVVEVTHGKTPSDSRVGREGLAAALHLHDAGYGIHGMDTGFKTAAGQASTHIYVSRK
jgi:hypothetical protein